MNRWNERKAAAGAILAAFGFAVFAVSAETYYWRGSNTAWSDWTNIAAGSSYR